MSDTSRLGTSTQYVTQPRTYDWQRGPGTGRDTGPYPTDKAWLNASKDYLKDSQAVFDHGRGVSTSSLVSFMEDLHEIVIGRVTSIGAEQYEMNNTQRFETYSQSRMLSEIVDELADCIAYIGMLTIKIMAAGRESA